MREISNLSTGRMRRSALLVVPVTLAALGLAGVSARPMLQLRAAQVGVDRALEDLGRVEHEAERHRILDEADAQARLDAALDQVRTMIPTGVNELDLHTAVRVAAELHGLSLSRLLVGELFDPGFERADDMVLLRPAEVGGRGRVDDLFAMLDTLRRLGIPITVLEISLERSPGNMQFDIYMKLGLYQREPVPREREESGLEGQGGRL